MAEGKVKPIAALTGLRAIAAIWVLAFHSSFSGLPFLPGPIRSTINIGFAAVSLFFVLSGFILTYNYVPRYTDSSNHRGFAIDFMMARFARVYPVYLFALLLSLPFGGIPAGQSGPITITLSALCLQAWDPYYLGLNMPGWSLSCEAFFYALFPFLLPGLLRLRRAHVWLLFIGCLLIGLLNALLSRVMSPLTLPKEHLFAFNPIVHLAEFVAGMAIGLVYVRKETPYWLRRSPDLLVGAGVVSLVIIASLHHVPYGFMHSGGLIGPFGLIILGLTREDGGFARLLSSKIAVLFGEASYSLYILQEPIKIMFNDLWLRQHGELAKPVWFKGATFFAVIGLALLAYRWIELPCRKRILNLYRRRVQLT